MLEARSEPAAVMLDPLPPSRSMPETGWCKDVCLPGHGTANAKVATRA